MKITKDDGEVEAGIYAPDEKEQEMLGELSDKIIDIMDGKDLAFEQQIFLLQSMVIGIAQTNGVIAFERRDNE